MERTPNKSQHTKLTLKNKILPPLLWEQLFDHESGALTNKLSRLPASNSTAEATTTAVAVVGRGGGVAEVVVAAVAMVAVVFRC